MNTLCPIPCYSRKWAGVRLDVQMRKMKPECYCGLPTTIRCSGCKKVYYCSKEHQLADWPSHKKVCNKFSFSSYSPFGKTYTIVCEKNLMTGGLEYKGIEPKLMHENSL